MKLKTALVSLALALTGSMAAAGPVSFGGVNQDEGDFSGSYQFTLGSDQLFTGLINTVSALKNDVTITSLILSKGGISYVFDGADDGSSLLWGGTTSSTIDIKGEEFVQWTNSYSLSPVLLSAGEWLLTVKGLDGENKNLGSYDVTLNGSTVPEPQTLGLALGALAAMAFLGRRKRAAR